MSKHFVADVTSQRRKRFVVPADEELRAFFENTGSPPQNVAPIR